ncbi:MAG: class I SAM-dependent methyltransferase [Dehalococcoidia bacterium]
MQESEERATIIQYNRWLAKDSLYARHMRFVLSPWGLPLLHTPLFRLSRRLPLYPDDQVLDVGCGRASVLSYLIHRVGLTQGPVGVDACRPLLALADHTNPRVNLLQASVTHLPFGDDSFDVVLCSYVVKHFALPDLYHLFTEARRVLRPGGRLALWEFLPLPTNLLTRLFHRILALEVTAEYLRPSSKVAEVVRQAGFAVVEPLRLGPFLYPPTSRLCLKAIK